MCIFAQTFFMQQKANTPMETEVVMTELVLPNDTNTFGNLMGGRLLYWMDIAAALAAMKHCGSPVVTASVDNISFEAPIKLVEWLQRPEVGDLHPTLDLTLLAHVHFVLQHESQKLFVREAIGRRLLDADGDRVAHAG